MNGILEDVDARAGDRLTREGGDVGSGEGSVTGIGREADERTGKAQVRRPRLVVKRAVVGRGEPGTGTE